MRKLYISLLTASMTLLAATSANAATYVGSYWVGSGTYWASTPVPVVYSAREAAALIFGGTANDYAISIFSASITNTAWVDGYGDTTHLKTDWLNAGAGTAVGEDYSLGDTIGLYNYPAFSAYVADHDTYYTNAASADASINYVFRLDAAPAVPEPATWAMMLAGFGLIGFAARRRSSVKTTVAYT